MEHVSRDIELRREIYKGLEVDSDMFKNMGMAEMQREMERRVLPLTNKIELSDEMRNRVDPSEEDVKIIINEVLNEIQSKRSHIKPDRSKTLNREIQRFCACYIWKSYIDLGYFIENVKLCLTHSPLSLIRIDTRIIIASLLIYNHRYLK